MAKLKEVVIQNFRNVESKRLVFEDLPPQAARENNCVIISGKNMIGKTNTLNAIHWAFTGVTLDGCADNRVNFPTNTPNVVTSYSTTLKFDTFEFKRECVMEDGKPTVYIYLNDEKTTSVRKGEALLHSNLGLSDMVLKEGKISIVRLLLNPLYFDTVPAKDLRKFFYSLSGISFKGLLENQTKIIQKVLTKYDKYDPYELCSKIDSAKKVVKADITTCNNAVKLFPDIKEKADALKAKKEKELKTIENDESLADKYSIEVSRVVNEFFMNAMGIKVCLLEKGVGDDVYSDVCYPILPRNGLPFALGSYAERYCVGIMFVKEVCKRWKINPLPILVDNMESLDEYTKSIIDGLDVQYIGALVK